MTKKVGTHLPFDIDIDQVLDSEQDGSHDDDVIIYLNYPIYRLVSLT